jgi:GT2 family glycosyltransferase
MKDKDPLISICILNYNGIKFVNRLFDSLRQVQFKNIEIIVVDNNSTDNSLSQIKWELSTSWVHSTKLIESRKNLGYAGGQNLAASFANGTYIYFLNIDCYVEPDFMDCVKFMESNRNIDICQPLIVNYDSNIIQNMGMDMGYLGHLSIHGKDKDVNSIEGNSTILYEISSVLGAAFAIRRELFKKIGGFDETFFMYFEETDLCWRAKLLGYGVYFYHNPILMSKVYHKAYGTISSNKRLNSLFTRNRLVSMLKNLQSVSLIFLFMMIVISIIGSKRPNIITRICGEFLLSIPKALKCRIVIQKLRIKRDKDIIKKLW